MTLGAAIITLTRIVERELAFISNGSILLITHCYLRGIRLECKLIAEGKFHRSSQRLRRQCIACLLNILVVSSDRPNSRSASTAAQPHDKVSRSMKFQQVLRKESDPALLVTRPTCRVRDSHLARKAILGCGEAANACRRPGARLKEVFCELFSQDFTFRQKFMVENLRPPPDRE